MSAVENGAKKLVSIAKHVSLQGKVVGDRIVLTQYGNTFELQMFKPTTLSDRGVISR